jgi:hypothetical protein
MRKKICHENIELCTVFSKGEGAVTGEAVDNEQPPHEVFAVLVEGIRRHIDLLTEGIPTRF